MSTDRSHKLHFCNGFWFQTISSVNLPNWKIHFHYESGLSIKTNIILLGYDIHKKLLIALGDLAYRSDNEKVTLTFDGLMGGDTMTGFESLDNIRTKTGILCFHHQREDLLLLNCAYAQMLRDQEIITQGEYKTIKAGLLESFPKVCEKDMKDSQGDLHYAFEKALFNTIDSKVASKLHVGRSRNDMYFTLYRMSVRKALLSVMQRSFNLTDVLQTEIKKHLTTVIPYYTYGQPSQPGTWGHYLESILELIAGDLKRMKRAFELTNQCPMGAAAGIGSSFNLDKEKVSQLLAFDRPIDNTILGNSDVNYFLETIFAFTTLNTTLMRVANDLEFFSSTECGILNCDEALCGGSSIMPQKKNAEAVELLRAMTSNWEGYFSNCLNASAVTLFPVHETYYFYERFWDNTSVLLDNVDLLSCIITHSQIRKEVAYQRALEGFTAATGMAEELTKEIGEPFEITHHIVGGMIKRLMQENRLQTKNMTPELLKEISETVLGHPLEKSQEAISELIDPLSSLNAKTTGGTPKPDDTKLLLEKSLKVLNETRAWYNEMTERLTQCKQKLIG